MRHVHTFTKTLLMTGLCFLVGSCSDDNFINQEQVQPKNELTIHTIPMEFIGDVVGFDQQLNHAEQQTTRGTSSSWSNGDKIYISFYNGSTIVPGEATYNSASGWSVSYFGNLATGTNLKCETRYFVNASNYNSSFIVLNSNSEIYEDENGTYTYNDSSLTVQATLSPKTGRLRFKGTPETKIYTTGISVYTTFTPETNTFLTKNSMISSVVEADGFTPYIYGIFDDDKRMLGLIGDDFAYTRICNKDILNAGESGYMTIPSETNHSNWQNGIIFKVEDIEFKMLPVTGFETGLFLMGETEVTEALYNTINGTPSSSIFPISELTYKKAREFVDKISKVMKISFDLPSTEQWFYAAKGGNKSKGYIYSGSDNPDEVAWYSGNTTKIQAVKSKFPNELGLYDMSGNVSEWSNKWVRTKDEGATYQCVWRRHGGYYGSSEDAVKNTSFISNFTTDWKSESEAWASTTNDEAQYKGTGLRLVINIK